MTDPNVLKALEGLESAVDKIHLHLVRTSHGYTEMADVGLNLNQTLDAISALRDEVEGEEKHPMHGSM